MPGFSQGALRPAGPLPAGPPSAGCQDSLRGRFDLRGLCRRGHRQPNAQVPLDEDQPLAVVVDDPCELADLLLEVVEPLISPPVGLVEPLDRPLGKHVTTQE